MPTEGVSNNTRDHQQRPIKPDTRSNRKQQHCLTNLVSNNRDSRHLPTNPDTTSNNQSSHSPNPDNHKVMPVAAANRDPTKAVLLSTADPQPIPKHATTNRLVSKLGVAKVQ